MSDKSEDDDLDINTNTNKRTYDTNLDIYPDIKDPNFEHEFYKKMEYVIYEKPDNFNDRKK